MNVHLHIDRIVLDGLDVAFADRARLQASIASELTRLVAEQGISPELARGIAVPSVRAPQIAVQPNARPAQLGAAIAGAVMGGVGGGRR